MRQDKGNNLIFFCNFALDMVATWRKPVDEKGIR